LRIFRPVNMADVILPPSCISVLRRLIWINAVVIEIYYWRF